MKLEQLGRHILVEYYNCDKEILKNHSLIEEFMCEAARRAKATIVTSCFHEFNPWGVSGAVIIQESHLTIHTWPEYGYASVDLYTCGDSVNPWVGFEYLENVLKAERSESTEIARGMIEKIRNFSSDKLDVITHKPTA
ncbi:adenosylmethionine decarboxylase [Clostridium tarantellae]|uniref:S-adenosylmethionine decarboxylase proenzyme n=1 Tax=Clostridium tarantellae TaxID=39493 RepID=A0A6I1ML54_9CLOT|nr:adenosylmethionine decarboxylase [Clostridium tarantellae]MPQ43473.1 S-adenosylmethionine decarboxylase proenzyme [Clostridium tarantellae]